MGLRHIVLGEAVGSIKVGLESNHVKGQGRDEFGVTVWVRLGMCSSQ